ncbi:LamG domain-containing protein [Kribbella sp. NBC_00359]|uniref:LamG domain-containing protein n=1 Tax=Kribbella sp. NBC_00359 TaxID=2975966 RepID=UPI002E221A39
MTALESMVANLTLPYRNGAYLQEVALGSPTTTGVTPVPQYSVDEYAIRSGVELHDVVPMYLVAPRSTVDTDICLYFTVAGRPAGEPGPQLAIPAGTPAWTSFVVPLGHWVSGHTRLTALREWPVPPGDSPGSERWRLQLVIGNLGRLLWVLGHERAQLAGLAADVGAQRNLATARGRSLDLVGQEVQVPRLSAAPHFPDPGTLAVYHLDDDPDAPVGGLPGQPDRVEDAMRNHPAQNQGAQPGAPGRFDRAFAFRSGGLPQPQCGAEYEFQQRLRRGDWDAGVGEREVRAGPYRRYGYREGAISVPGPDGAPAPVWVNDEARERVMRGQVTTACFGFRPNELPETLRRFAELGRSVQQAIDYYGDWWGLDDQWFSAAYQRYEVSTPLERCPVQATPLSYLRIPDDRDLDVPAEQGFTVEAFVLPEPTQDQRLRVVAAKSREIFYGGPLQFHCLEGWALSLGPFDCIANNVSFAVSDLADRPRTDAHHEHVVSVIGDLDLGDGRWHHLAGVIDRQYQVLRLYVDGVQRGCSSLRGVGAIANQEDVLIGNVDYHYDAPYDGLIDEVRLSSVGRHQFQPVLGEADHRYRSRLEIYRRWRVPTRDELQAGLRELLDDSPYDPEIPVPALPAIEVSEQVASRVCVERRLVIRPLSLPPGGHMDLEGSRSTTEDATCGPRDPAFHEWQLVEHSDSRAGYADANAHRMQLATARCLDTLLALVTPWLAQTSSTVDVIGGYEPGSDERRSVGRAVLLSAAALPPGVLAAFAHQACFDFVQHGPGALVRAAVREESDKLEVATAAEVAAGIHSGPGAVVELELGDEVRLTVSRPAVPSGGDLGWVLTRCGPARATLTTVPDDDVAIELSPTAAGRLIVQAEVRRLGSTVTGRREVWIVPRTVPPCTSIGADGALNVDEATAAGTPDGFFTEAFLLTVDDGRVDFPAGADSARTQLGPRDALLRLLDLVDAEPNVTGRLVVLRGYDPQARDLARVGRKLMLAHESVPLGRLAALAHRAGFAWVEHPPYPDGIFVATGAEPPLSVQVGRIERLAKNAVVNWLGIMRPDLPEAPVPTGATFDPTDPANKHSDPSGRVVYDEPAANLMSPPTQAALNDLLDRLEADAATDKLHVVAGYDDQAPDRRRIGCALRLRHEQIPLERLGALAHLAGFDLVKHVTVPSDPAARYAYASRWRGENLSGEVLDDPALLVDYGLIGPDELAEEAVTRIRIAPDVLAWQPPPPPAGEGGDGQPPPPPQPVEGGYDWCLTRYGPGAGRLDSLPPPAAKLFTAAKPGVVGVRAELMLADGVAPYRCELVVAADDDVPKLVYDDVLNFVAAHLPVGVEARTLRLRARVPELMADPDRRDLGTIATYPSYRQPRRTGEPAASSVDIAANSCGCPPWPGPEQQEDGHD